MWPSKRSSPLCSLQSSSVSFACIVGPRAVCLPCTQLLFMQTIIIVLSYYKLASTASLPGACLGAKQHPLLDVFWRFLSSRCFYSMAGTSLVLFIHWFSSLDSWLQVALSSLSTSLTKPPNFSNPCPNLLPLEHLTVLWNRQGLCSHTYIVQELYCTSPAAAAEMWSKCVNVPFQVAHLSLQAQELSRALCEGGH